MRTGRLVILSILVCTFVLVAPALLAGHHVDGTWILSVSLGDGQGGDATFELAENEAGRITGTYSGAVGQAEVTGTVNGNEVELSFDSQAGKITYKGTIEGDAMKGTCTYGQLGEGTFEGKRKTAE
jgi:hypothetical protein